VPARVVEYTEGPFRGRILRMILERYGSTSCSNGATDSRISSDSTSDRSKQRQPARRIKEKRAKRDVTTANYIRVSRRFQRQPKQRNVSERSRGRRFSHSRALGICGICGANYRDRALRITNIALQLHARAYLSRPAKLNEEPSEKLIQQRGGTVTGKRGEGEERGWNGIE